MPQSFEDWFKEFNTWGLSKDELLQCSLGTPGDDGGDVVFTSTKGSAMTRHICSRWIAFHDAAQCGWNAALSQQPQN